MGHKDLRLGQIAYILVFYNISFSWFLPLDGFQFNFLLRDRENDLYMYDLYMFYTQNLAKLGGRPIICQGWKGERIKVN